VTGALTMLAYRPILDPLPAHGPWWWLLLIPLAFGVSVVYKAVRAADLRRFWAQALGMTLQIVLVMGALGVALHVVVEWVLPRVF
jgi:hypothetical protein